MKPKPLAIALLAITLTGCMGGQKPYLNSMQENVQHAREAAAAVDAECIQQIDSQPLIAEKLRDKMTLHPLDQPTTAMLANTDTVTADERAAVGLLLDLKLQCQREKIAVVKPYAPMGVIALLDPYNNAYQDIGTALYSGSISYGEALQRWKNLRAEFDTNVQHAIQSQVSKDHNFTGQQDQAVRAALMNMQRFPRF